MTGEPMEMLALQPVRTQASGPAAMEQFLLNMLTLLGTGETLALELWAQEGRAEFRLVVPARYLNTVAREVQALLGNCRCSPLVPFDPPGNSYMEFSAWELQYTAWTTSQRPWELKVEGLLPIQLYPAFGALEPGQGILSVAARTTQAILWWQLLLTPMFLEQQDEVAKVLPHLMEKMERREEIPRCWRLMERVIEKMTQPLWTVAVRALAAAWDEQRDEQVAAELLDGLERYLMLFSNVDGSRWAATEDLPPLRIYLTEMEKRVPGCSPCSLLTCREVASLWHLPTGSRGAVALEPAPSRLLPPPPALLKPGEGQVYLGRGMWGLEEVPLYLDTTDLHTHWYVRGTTGSGKTAFIYRQVLSAFRSGRFTVVILTPKLGEALLFLRGLREEEVERVLLLDQTDTAFPFGLNLLDVPEGVDPVIVAEQALLVFKKLFAEAWGHETEQVMRRSLLALLELPERNLLLLPRLLTEAGFRARVVARLRDPESRRYWQEEYERYGPAQRRQKDAPPLNKIAALTGNPHLRAIVGQRRSTVRWEELLDSGWLILVQLDGRQETAAGLLGALFITGIQLAAMARGRREGVRPVLVFVDEFQNFVTEATPKVLAEARAAGLFLRLIHQHARQVEPGLLSAILANCAGQVYFRASGEDAGPAVGELLEQVSRQDLTGLERYRAYTRVEHRGRLLPVFTLLTEPIPEEPSPLEGAVRERSRKLVGRPREEVEREVARILRDQGRRERELPRGPVPRE